MSDPIQWPFVWERIAWLSPVAVSLYLSLTLPWWLEGFIVVAVTSVVQASWVRAADTGAFKRGNP